MKTFIVGNWKCNPKSFREAKRLFEVVKKGVGNIRETEVVVCPPFLYLAKLNTRGSRLKLGAQNCFWEDRGAFSGEVSASMLKSVGCSYVIVGHSERRRLFKETDTMINKKVKAVLKANLISILCIGETEEEKNKGKFAEVLSFQIKKALKGVSRKDIQKVIIAYEPVWAIGTGKACRPIEAQVIRLFIQKIITRLYSRNIAERLPVLYGGSVNQKNAIDYLKESGMSGLLIGGVSLRPKEFIKIIKECERI